MNSLQIKTFSCRVLLLGCDSRFFFCRFPGASEFSQDLVEGKLLFLERFKAVIGRGDLADADDLVVDGVEGKQELDQRFLVN
jgi:hypothetical protein